MTAHKEGAQQSPAQPASVKVAAAKGRPMLSWVGKRPLREVRAYPAQLVERFSADGSVSDAVDWSDWPDRYERGGLLFHGDNKEVLAHLLANGFRGKVDLVYIDPPFDSGADYVRRVQLRGASGSARLDGESYTLGEQIQYTDIWANDTYLQFMYERLLLLKELLATRGSVWLHCDARRSHQLRTLLDEVLGPDAFRSQVIWRRKGGSALSGMSRMSVATDTLFLYARSEDATFNEVRMAPDPTYVAEMFTREDPDRRRYMLTVVSSPTYRPNLIYDYKGYATPPNGWRYSRSRMEELDRAGELYFPDDKSKQIYKRIYLDEYEGQVVNDLWTDISLLKGKSAELADYPTQKPEALLSRVLAISSNPGDLVLDCFIGSGTTAAVAQKLGRRWIGADINKGAIQTTMKRLAGVIEEQASASASQQQKAFEETDDGGAPSLPAQLAFTSWRVNDYDLQIQHNEAVNLACEHLGVERTRADPFFDGTLGTELAKIVPFNHPVAPPDLEAVVAELDARPGEERNVVLVALGMEIGCAKWLDDYNRGRPINKLRVIELRSDPKYGRFFEHRPASARVRLDGSTVVIDDFISPSILERLSHTDGVLSPQVTEWRSMVDSVMIDTAYDGEVFDVVVADIPERKTDLVAGTYELELPEDSAAPVSVKITDMLGEEVLAVLQR